MMRPPSPRLRTDWPRPVRSLGVARRSAVKAQTQAVNQLRSLLVSAPSFIRDIVLKAKAAQCVAACAALLSDDEGPVLASLKMTLRLLAKRWTALHEELRELDKQLSRLTKLAAPRLLARFGVGPQTAATLLVTAGDNPTRLRSEAALAALCGVSPISASSGKVSRHRLNRGGQRQANNALWTIAMARMRSDPRTRDYVARRPAQGLSKKEIHRCLKRYIVRELYPLILADLKDSALFACHRSVNACGESLFGSLKVERLQGQRFETRRHAKDECPDLILSYTPIGGNHLSNKRDEINTKSL